MEEKKILIIYTVLAYALGISLYLLFVYKYDLRFLFSDLLVKNYQATLTLDKNISFKENINFEVKEYPKYRMLFRYWETPVVYGKDLDKPFIKLLKVNSKNNIVYFKDFEGNVYLSEDNRDLALFVRDKAFKNEIGIVNPKYFKEGFYNLDIFYNIFPPIQTDEKYSHFNFKIFSEEHIPIKNIFIKINDPNKLIKDIYPHLANFSVEKKEFGYLIKGNATGGIVEIEFLLKKFNFNTFLVNDTNIKDKTESSNKFYTILLKFINFLEILLKILVFGFPIFVYIFYKKFGEEKFFTVPKNLHYIPNKNREPFEVNLFFSGDAIKSDINGFIATLLNLARKKYIKIYKDGDDLKIEILKDKGDTNYENKVLQLLKSQAIPKDNKEIFSLKTFKGIINVLKDEENLEKLKSIKNYWDMVINATYFYDKSAHIDTTGKRIITILKYLSLFITIPFILWAVLFTNNFVIYNVDIYKIFILLIVLTVEILIIDGTKTQVFGRWKKDYYKEYLEWQAFKNTLSNLAMIKKYKPEDISIWKDWLIYGTALGVADNVIKAMKEFNIKIPEIEPESSYYLIHHIPSTYTMLNKSIISLEAKERASNISSGGGGGFGVGGGFGGGGLGGR